MGESLASPQPAVSAVSVLVAFPGTSQLSTNLVNSGKYFAVGMVAQSQDNKLGQDYANFAMVYLTSSGSPVIVGEVWTLPDGQCSTFLGIPYSCPNPTLDFAASWACDCYTTSSYVDMVTLTMQWSSGNLNWLATVEGVQYSLFTYTPGSSQQTSFHVGQHSDPACTILGFTLCVEEYFQFGAMFNATPKSGWEAYVGSPRYFSVSDNTWKAVQQGITGAQNPLFDAIYGVGGGGISGTNALDGCSNSGKFPGIFVPTSLVFGQLIIYPSSFSGHKLWDTNCSIDSYAPAATFVDSSAGGNTPPAGSWQNGNFQVSFNFYDTGPVQAAAYLPLCVDYVESWNGASWVVTRSVSTLNCFPGPICCPSFTVITSPSGDCQFQGVNACRVNLWAEDFVGNISPVTSRYFSIDTVPPSAPSLSSPQNGASVLSTPTLTWSTATDATSGVASYTLQLSTSSSFTNPTTYNGLTTTSYTIVSPLSMTTWYWRVEAIDNAGNIGPWSSTGSFIVFDFTISTSQTSVPLTLEGSGGSSTITLTSLGSPGTVSVSVTVSPAGPVVSIWPTSLALSPGGSATSTLDISAGGATPGTYTVTVTGTSGSLQHSVSITVIISGDFGVSANPGSLTIIRGSSGTSSITLTSLTGFSGTVTLASSTSVTVNFVSVDDPWCRAFGLLADQSLDIGFWNTQPGSVIGTGCGSFSYSNTLSLSPGSHFLEFGVSAWVGHWRAQVYVNGVLMADVDTNIFNHVHVPIQVGGGVSVSPIVAGGPTASLSQTSVALSAGGFASVTLTVSTTTPTLLQGYVFTVTATSGGISHSTTVSVSVVDFSIAVSPTAMSFLSGGFGSATVTLNSLGGFSGTVSLSKSASPTTGLTVSCPSSVTLASAGTANAGCSFGSSTGNVYSVSITGSSGTVSHTATVTVYVQDFTITASPAALSISRGSSGSSTLNVTSLFGFSGNITLTATVSPFVNHGPIAVLYNTPSCPATNNMPLNQACVVVSPGGWATATLALFTASSTPRGAYSVTVTASIGTITHYVTVTVTVS